MFRHVETRVDDYVHWRLVVEDFFFSFFLSFFSWRIEALQRHLKFFSGDIRRYLRYMIGSSREVDNFVIWPRYSEIAKILQRDFFLKDIKVNITLHFYY